MTTSRFRDMVKWLLILWLIAALISVAFAERANADTATPTVEHPWSARANGRVHINVYGDLTTFGAKKAIKQVARETNFDVSFRRCSMYSHRKGVHCIRIVDGTFTSEDPNWVQLGESLRWSFYQSCKITLDPSVADLLPGYDLTSVPKHEFLHCIGMVHHSASSCGLETADGFICGPRPVLSYVEWRAVERAYRF